MKTKFTKGPWRASATSVYPDREPRCFEIKIQRPIENSISLQEAQANARLIAAAPDMYESLEILVETLSSFIGDDRMDRYINVLKKARGES